MGYAWRTEDDLLALPDDDMRHELVAGVIVAEPLPSWRHDEVRQALEQHLIRYVQERTLGKVRSHVGYLLRRDPDTVRGPDLSFVRRERIDAVEIKGFFHGAPDLAIEILSPSNRAGETRAKVADYLNAGCRLVWVIDPKKKMARVHRTPNTSRRVDLDGALDGEDVLPGFSVSLASIFLDI